MADFDHDDIPTRFNGWFVALSILLMEFCILIFPVIRHVLSSLGAELPTLAALAFAHCSLIEAHPALASTGFATYYLASLRLLRRKAITVVNLVLFAYLALLILSLGMPLRSLR